MKPSIPEDEHAAFFGANPLFEQIPPGSRVFQKFLKSVQLLKVSRNESVFEEHEEANDLFLLRDGEIRIVQRDNHEFRILSFHGRGSLFGEVSFLNNEFYRSRAVAALDSSYYRIPGKAFLKLMAEEHSVGDMLTRLLSRRLSQQQEYETESPARIFSFLYPEDPARGSILARALATSLFQEHPSPVILFAFNEQQTTDCGPTNCLGDLLHRWPHISIEEIRNMVEIQHLPYHVVNGKTLFEDEALAKKMADHIPGILGLFKKYFSAILVDCGGRTDHPVISRILTQSDRLILTHSLENTADAALSHPWKRTVEYCKNRLPDFLDRFLTVSDETESRNRPLHEIQKLDPLLLESALYMRTHVRIKSSYPAMLPGEDERFNMGVDRLARRLSGTSRGLTLGGGGARALAHVGVLEILEQEKIVFDAVAGTSMGAVIGAAYAMGIRARDIRYITKNFLPDSGALLDKHLPFVSFFKGNKVRTLLEKFFQEIRFEDLEIPFYCNGSDLVSGRVIIFQKGRLVDALHASVSLPGLFPPVQMDTLQVVDGAVLNNLPGDILRKRGYNRIVGVNITPFEDPLPIVPDSRRVSGLHTIHNYLTLPPILKIISRSISIQGNELLRFHLNDFDYVITPDVVQYDMFDFHRGEEIIRTGKEATLENLVSIKEALSRKKMVF